MSYISISKLSRYLIYRDKLEANSADLNYESIANIKIPRSAAMYKLNTIIKKFFPRIFSTEFILINSLYSKNPIKKLNSE